jgi:hypothetical protein
MAHRLANVSSGLVKSSLGLIEATTPTVSEDVRVSTYNARNKDLPEVASLWALAMQDASIRREPGHHKEPDVDVVCSFETRRMPRKSAACIPVWFLGCRLDCGLGRPCNVFVPLGEAVMDA